MNTFKNEENGAGSRGNADKRREEKSFKDLNNSRKALLRMPHLFLMHFLHNQDNKPTKSYALID